MPNGNTTYAMSNHSFNKRKLRIKTEKTEKPEFYFL